MNILGEGFPEEIINQITQRQKVYGSGYANGVPRTNEEIIYLNANTSWCKLVSSVNIDNPAIIQDKSLTKLGNNITGNKLAKKFVLFNGITDIDSNQQRAGVTDNTNVLGINSKGNNFAYGIGGTDFGINPMMGIKSAHIKHENRGSIRRATVQIKAWNKVQFDIIDVLYLRLGFNVLLEWGHSMYYDNKGNFQNGSDINNSLAINFLEGKIDATKDKSKATKPKPTVSKTKTPSPAPTPSYVWTPQPSNANSQTTISSDKSSLSHAGAEPVYTPPPPPPTPEETTININTQTSNIEDLNEVSYINFLKLIQQKRLSSNGNYDAMFAKVSNFHWSFQKDGSYDITIDLVSVGDIVESFKINALIDGVSLSINPNSPTSEDPQIIIESLSHKSTIGQHFWDLIKSDASVQPSPPTSTQSPTSAQTIIKNQNGEYRRGSAFEKM